MERDNFTPEPLPEELLDRLQQYDLETIHAVIGKYGFPEEDINEWMKHFDEIETGSTPT